MSFDDPFDNIPEDNAEEAQVQEKPVVIKTDQVGDGDGKIVLTFKEGAGFDSSWVVVHASSVDDANEILNYAKFGDLLKRTKEVAQFFRGGHLPTQARRDNAAVPAAANYAAPQGAQQAPGGEKRFCEHGEMVFKSGVAKATGKPYSLFSCTAPRDQQCKAQFLK